MRNIWVIAQKEYKHYFISPVAYAVALAVFLILGIFFFTSLLVFMERQQAPTVQIIVGPLITLFMFSVPAITMRTLADEQKTGTLELLMTAPVREWEVVIGKWLGSVFFLLTILLATWFYPAVLNQLVQPGIDQGLMLTAYLGLFLMVSALLAIGVMTSSFFSNQIAAFFATLGIVLLFWLIGYPAQAAGSASTLTGEILRYLDMGEHFYYTFFSGIIEIKDIVYFLSIIALSLFVGTMSLETRRWR
jgi:ABC-2 type transport system permease protein